MNKHIRNIVKCLKDRNNIVIKDVKGYRIIYANEKILLLNEVGKLIINYLIKGVDEKIIVKMLSRKYKVKRDIIKKDLKEFIKKLDRYLKEDYYISQNP